MEEIKLVHHKSDYSLEISDTLEKKIRVLCNKFPQTEWSGVLFYTYTGSFENNDIKFVAEDMMFMDLGDATSTEFDLDDSNVASYIVDHDLFGCQCGLIHSHNQMQAFFSGQDDSMLKQEGGKRNHFLSLVVNNAGNYVARVTSKEIYKYDIIGNCTFLTFDNVEAHREVKETKEQTIIGTYDLNIIKHEQSCPDYDELMSRIDECNKKKEEKKKEKEIRAANTYFGDFSNSRQTSLWPMWGGACEKKEEEKEEKKEKEEFIKDDVILTEKECANYAAQLLTLNFFATKEDIASFLPKMERLIKERFNTEQEYTEALRLMCDEIIDYELGYSFMPDAEHEDIDYFLACAKMEIAEYIDRVTGIKKNNYIEILTDYLYA